MIDERQSGPVGAALWDMDGVIVDTEVYHFRAWARLCREQGVELTEADFKRTFGLRNPEIIKALLDPSASQSTIERLANQKEDYFRQLIRDQIRAEPGAIELMNGLREADFVQAIASSAPRQNIDLMLNTLCIAEFFSVVASAEDVTTGKPDPEIFLLAAKRLAVPPDRCVVIEDSVAGVQAAKAGDMKCIALASTHPPERLAAADLVVDSLEDLDASDIIALVSG